MMNNSVKILINWMNRNGFEFESKEVTCLLKVAQDQSLGGIIGEAEGDAIIINRMIVSMRESVNQRLANLPAALRVDRFDAFHALACDLQRKEDAFKGFGSSPMGQASPQIYGELADAIEETEGSSFGGGWSRSIGGQFGGSDWTWAQSPWPDQNAYLTAVRVYGAPAYSKEEYNAAANYFIQDINNPVGFSKEDWGITVGNSWIDENPADAGRRREFKIFDYIRISDEALQRAQGRRQWAIDSYAWISDFCNNKTKEEVQLAANQDADLQKLSRHQEGLQEPVQPQYRKWAAEAREGQKEEMRNTNIPEELVVRCYLDPDNRNNLVCTTDGETWAVETGIDLMPTNTRFSLNERSLSAKADNKDTWWRGRDGKFNALVIKAADAAGVYNHETGEVSADSVDVLGVANNIFEKLRDAAGKISFNDFSIVGVRFSGLELDAFTDSETQDIIQRVPGIESAVGSFNAWAGSISDASEAILTYSDTNPLSNSNPVTIRPNPHIAFTEEILYGGGWKSEEELAGLMAHEISHIILGHTYENLNRMHQIVGEIHQGMERQGRSAQTGQASVIELDPTRYDDTYEFTENSNLKTIEALARSQMGHGSPEAVTAQLLVYWYNKAKEINNDKIQSGEIPSVFFDNPSSPVVIPDGQDSITINIPPPMVGTTSTRYIEEVGPGGVRNVGSWNDKLESANSSLNASVEILRQTDESHADAIGQLLMNAANYDPAAMSGAWEVYQSYHAQKIQLYEEADYDADEIEKYRQGVGLISRPGGSHPGSAIRWQAARRNAEKIREHEEREGQVAQPEQ